MSTVKKSVVFLYRSDSSGQHPTIPLGTAFIVQVPLKSDPSKAYNLLVTARHVIDPQWACEPEPNPSRVFARLNLARFDSAHDDTGTGIFPLTLVRQGSDQNVFTSLDESVDAAVILVRQRDWLKDYDYSSIFLSDFANTDELNSLTEGYDIVSAGLLPAFVGDHRNYPIFKFGHIAAIPNERIIYQCPDGRTKRLWFWFVAINLVGGNSGSPVVLSPPLYPGSSITRASLIGLQSLSFGGVDVAGMTPAKYIFEIIAGIGLPDANLYRGSVKDAKP